MKHDPVLRFREANGRFSRDIAELTAWIAVQPDFASFDLTYDERCKIIGIRARLDEARAKINEARAAYDALIVEARLYAKVVTDRLCADYPRPANVPRSAARDAMIKPWFEISYYDPGEHEHWIMQLPVSVVDGRVETVAEALNPPIISLR